MATHWVGPKDFASVSYPNMLCITECWSLSKAVTQANKLHFKQVKYKDYNGESTQLSRFWKKLKKIYLNVLRRGVMEKDAQHMLSMVFHRIQE